LSDQLDQAVKGQASNTEAPASQPGGGVFAKGGVRGICSPVLPDGAAEGSEITQFEMEVDSPLVAFAALKPLLISSGLIEVVLVAWRQKSEKVYQVIWPIEYHGQFQDIEDI
jgi:hypothetical protein